MKGKRVAKAIPELQAGDCLLYRPDGVFGLLVALKTWTWVSHVEVYLGGGISAASRSTGVNIYPLRKQGLGYVLRPKSKLNIPQARAWAETVRGQGYDFLGLLCFTMIVDHGERQKMFCSEFATHFYHKAEFWPFSGWTRPDHVAPAQFLQSAEFWMLWHDREQR